ncbi:uncharacterized protein [Littorina saxatilis]|uniref:EF-hand domain-containing protein n=1 Tax=Littorina saxatilis TaxID=31220 RepID=A0AAN9BGI9_9CAEN
MKAVLLLSLLLLAAVVQDSEAWRWGSRKVRDKWIAVVRPIFDKIGKTVRGKRAALPMNRLEEVNAIDLAATFNLDRFAVLGLFDDCDVNEDGALAGQEVEVFLGKIEGLVKNQP